MVHPSPQLTKVGQRRRSHPDDQMLVLERRRIAALEVLQVGVPVYRVRELVGQLL